jgi:hypothetical protein
MPETKPKRRWFRFSIRDLLWLTALVALAVGWWLDHRMQLKRYEQLEDSGNIIETRVMGHEYEGRIEEQRHIINTLHDEISSLQDELSDAKRSNTNH